MSEFLDKHKTTLIVSFVLTIIIIILSILYFTKSCTQEQCAQSPQTQINQSTCGSVSADNGGPFLPITFNNCKNLSSAFWIDANNTVHNIGKSLTNAILIINAIMIVVPYDGVVFIPQSNTDSTQIVYSKNVSNYTIYSSSTPVNGVLCYDYRYVIHPFPGSATNNNLYFNSTTNKLDYGLAIDIFTGVGNFLIIPTGNSSSNSNYILLDVGTTDPGTGKVLTANTDNTVTLSDLTSSVISSKQTELKQSSLATGNYDILLTNDPIVWQVNGGLRIAPTIATTLSLTTSGTTGQGVVAMLTSSVSQNSYAQTSSTLYKIYFPKYGDRFILSY